MQDKKVVLLRVFVNFILLLYIVVLVKKSSMLLGSLPSCRQKRRKAVKAYNSIMISKSVTP
jgi:hypothetical protein